MEYEQIVKHYRKIKRSIKKLEKQLDILKKEIDEKTPKLKVNEIFLSFS